MEEKISYWLTSAQDDLETAEVLFEKGKYHWSLFIGHLVIEKMLKAFYVRDNQELPPKIHKLDILAAKTKLILSSQEFDFLKELNQFNIEECYPDEKLSFYKICTKEFTENYLKAIKELHQCLLAKLK